VRTAQTAIITDCAETRRDRRKTIENAVEKRDGTAKSVARMNAQTHAPYANPAGTSANPRAAPKQRGNLPPEPAVLLITVVQR
jgi:hypothetical protein